MNEPLTPKEECMDLLYQYSNGLLTKTEYWEKIKKIPSWEKYVCNID